MKRHQLNIALTLASLTLCAAMLIPACSALEEAAKQTSAIGRAGKAVEGQADGVESDAQAARAALAEARKTGGVGPEAEPFRGGSRDGDRLNTLERGGYPWSWARDSGAGGVDPSALDGRAGQGARLDDAGQVGSHWPDVSGPLGFGDLPGDWLHYPPGDLTGGESSLACDGWHGQAGRGGDGSSTDEPGGGGGAARSIGGSGAGDGPGLRRGLQGGETSGAGGTIANTYRTYGPRVALAGLGDAGYIDLIVCVWLAFAGKWAAGKCGLGSGVLLKKLLGWLATKLGAVQPPVAQAPTNTTEPTKTS